MIWSHLSPPVPSPQVANHVVQALLNQKVSLPFLPVSMAGQTVARACDGCDVLGQDLREECIKLKMLVFDLERQNRALCELFQQKLPNQTAAHLQVASSALVSSASFAGCSGADGALSEGRVWTATVLPAL